MAQRWKIGNRLPGRWTQVLNKKIKKMQGGYNSLKDADYQSDYSHVVIRRDGLCAVYQCVGAGNRKCDICDGSRMTGYQKIVNDYSRAESNEESLNREADQVKSLLLNIYLESPCISEFCPLLVTRSTTTVDAIRGVAIMQKNENHHMYTIVEHWKDFEAERILEDHELIQDVRQEQVRIFHSQFVFLYRKELEKYEYVTNKKDFFIHPSSVRSINYKTDNEDPLFIQVHDKFYSGEGEVTTFNEPPFIAVAESDNTVLETSNILYTGSEHVPEEDLVNPIFCGSVFVKDGHTDMTVAEIEKLPEKREHALWLKKYLLLRDRKLFFVDSHQNMLKCYYIDDLKFAEMVSK